MDLAAKIVYGSWRWSGAFATLVFRSDQQFVASNGEVVEFGEYRRVSCPVTNRDITIPFIASIPATTDSTTNKEATWTTWFEDQGGTKRLDWLVSGRLPHTYSSPVAWADLFNFNKCVIGAPSPEAISFDQARLLFASLIAGISPTVLASGIGTLVAAQAVTVLDTHVAADSPIRLLPKTENITGNLRAFNRVVGISFDVISDNGADSGNFRWEIYP